MIAQRLVIFLAMTSISALNIMDPRIKRLACLEIYPNDTQWKRFSSDFKQVMQLAYQSIARQRIQELTGQQAVSPDLTIERDLDSNLSGIRSLFFFNSQAKNEAQISNAKKMEVFEANVISELFPGQPEGWVPTDFYVTLPEGAQIISYEIVLISGYFYEVICYKYNNMFYYAQINTGIRPKIKPDDPESRRLADETHDIGKDMDNFEQVFSHMDVTKGFMTDNINLINSCYGKRLNANNSVRLPMNFFSKYVNKAF
jgi:hypothetical protein